MLRFLAIQNLAVIEAVEIEFDAGLTVLTGETGAGKSILVEAVGLLLGGRASADLVRTGEECATVQAIFDADDGGELVVRREITAQGRSRAFVNGSLVTAGALRELGARLVDLHGQHEHQALLDPKRTSTFSTGSPAWIRSGSWSRRRSASCSPRAAGWRRFASCPGSADLVSS